MPEIHYTKKRRGNAQGGKQNRVPEKPYWGQIDEPMSEEETEQDSNERKDPVEAKEETENPSRTSNFVPRSRRRKRPLSKTGTPDEGEEVGDSLSKVSSPSSDKKASPGRFTLNSASSVSNDERQGSLVPKLESLLSEINATLDLQKQQKQAGKQSIEVGMEHQQSLIERMEKICQRQERALERSESNSQELKQEVVSLKASIRKFQNEQRSNDERIKKLEDRLAESQQQERAYATQLLELTNSKRKYDEALRQRDIQIQAMGEKYDSLKCTYQTRVSEMRGSQADLKQFESENRELKSLWKQVKSENRELKSLCEQVENENRELKMLWKRQAEESDDSSTLVHASPSRRDKKPAESPRRSPRQSKAELPANIVTTYSADIVPSSDNMKKSSRRGYKTGNFSSRSSRARLKGSIPSFDCLAGDRLGEPIITIDSD